MKLMKLFIFIFVTLLLFTGCSKNRTPTENPAGAGGKTSDQGIDPVISMRDYFLPDGSKGHFKGEGNELADFDIQVTQPHKNYFVVFENNKDTLLRRIFEVKSDRIDLLDSNIVSVDTSFPSLDELNAMKPISVYLQKPFSKGTVFGDWTIIQTGVKVETPYQAFDNAFVIESKDKDVVLRKYFVSGYGEVKRESAMTTGDGSVVVTTSTLESLGK